MRTILTALAMSVGTFALTLTLAASNGARQYGNTIITNNFDPTALIVSKDKNFFKQNTANQPQEYNPSFGTVTSAIGGSRQIQMLDDNDLARLRDLPGVKSVRPAISLGLRYITRDGARKYVATAQAYNAYRTPDLLAGAIPASIPTHSIILPEAYVHALGFTSAGAAINQTVRLAVNKQASASALTQLLAKNGANGLSSPPANSVEERFKVIAVLKKPSSLLVASNGLTLYVSEPDIIALNDIATKGSSDYHTYLTAYVEVANGTNSANLTTVQNEIQKAGYGAESVLNAEQAITQVITVLQGIVSIFGAVAVIASLFGVINTMYISVLQRTREIGLMKALGMHKKDVARLFEIEAALIGFFGGIIGSILAFVAGTIANPFIAKALGIGNTKLLQFNAAQILGLIIALIILAILAGFLPARKAAKLDPIVALRTE